MRGMKTLRVKPPIDHGIRRFKTDFTEEKDQNVTEITGCN